MLHIPSVDTTFNKKTKEVNRKIKMIYYTVVYLFMLTLSIVFITELCFHSFSFVEFFKIF